MSGRHPLKGKNSVLIVPALDGGESVVEVELRIPSQLNSAALPNS